MGVGFSPRRHVVDEHPGGLGERREEVPRLVRLSPVLEAPVPPRGRSGLVGEDTVPDLANGGLKGFTGEGGVERAG